MECPKCQSQVLKALETRTLDKEIKRRRECQECFTRFITIERFEREIKPKDSIRKLTVEDVIKIKSMLFEGVSVRNIAEKFKVNKDHIYRIKSGEKWGSVVL